ncbi:ABC transporter permease [Candidatus Micrarchaeota archaeon]|nr:ABC transporter permease [Candidatus Micrarchaeota archaeon]MBU1930451.1 ABC transporter permease [Candidatus Micrarchaeota archaeon]
MLFGLLKKLLFPFKIAWLIITTLLDLVSNPEIIQVAFKNLGQQKMRRNLTLLGVIIGVGAIITLAALGDSLNASIEEQFEAMGLNNVFVEPGGGMGFDAAFSRIPEKDIRIVEGIPNVEKVVPFFETSAIATKGKEEASVFLVGVKAEHQEVLEEMGYISLKEGRLLSDNDVYSLVVFENFLEDTFEKELQLRETLEIGGKKFRIVGVSNQSDVSFANLGFITMVFTSKKALELFGEIDPVELVVQVSSKEHVPEVARRIEQRLERSHGQKDFSVLTSESILDIALQVIGVVQLFVLAIAAIALVVGAIGIMNTMFMAVTERTREIGTMKAIGATNATIRSIFLAEAGIVGIVGGAMGIGIGLLLAFATTFGATVMGFPLDLIISPFLILGGLLFSFLIGIIAGIAPSEKAMALDPVVAIRYE